MQTEEHKEDKKIIDWVVFITATILMLFLTNYMKISYWTAILYTFVFILLFSLALGGETLFKAKIMESAPLPEKKFKDRILKMNEHALELEQLGFEKIDDLYLKNMPGVFTYIFKHRDNQYYLNVYDMGKAILYDVYTLFAGDCSLITSNSSNNGTVPLKKNEYLQIFPGASVENLVEEHGKALSFFSHRGLTIENPGENQIKQRLLEALNNFNRRLIGMSFWLFKYLYWIITNHGKIYRMSIEEQFRKGIAEL